VTKKYDFKEGVGEIEIPDEHFEEMERALKALKEIGSITEEDYKKGMYKIKNKEKFIVNKKRDDFDRSMKGI
jgi:hypothetical protein